MTPRRYRVEYGSRRVERELRRLPLSEAQRIAAVIELLGDNPRPANSIPVQGHPGDFRIRVGGYRIIYQIDYENRTVYVDRIVRRDEGTYRYR